MRGRFVVGIWTASVGQRRSYSTARTSTAKGFWDSPERVNDNQLIIAKVFGDAGEETKRSVPAGPRTLVRRFISDSLYSPTHGYFTRNKKLQILDAPAALDFKILPSLNAFQESLATLYATQTTTDIPGMERPVPQMDSGGQATGFRSQVWHTPTELFKPWFGIAVAERIVERHLARQSPTDPLIIYEAGPGNGTLMRNILDHLSDRYPQLYATVEYTLIEISPNLAQRLPLTKSPHASKIKLAQKSILDWTSIEERHCFVIAMEVIDNFAHDVVRYDNITGTPYQGLVSTLPDSEGSFEEVYEPVTDPLIKAFLDTRTKIGHLPAFELQKWKRKMRMLLPFAHNLSQKEFVPTETFRLTRILADKFPRHSLILSDFHTLPDTIEGLNAPVVQTMFDGVMVPCSTYLVEPGWFDIFFPHDFTLLKGFYDYHAGIMQNENQQKSEVMTYKAFLKRYGDPSQTQLQSGENPMLSYYENVSFLVS